MPDNERLLGTNEVLKLLDLPYHRLNYLFRSRRLKDENFLKVNGQRVFRASDLNKVREALFAIETKG